MAIARRVTVLTLQNDLFALRHENAAGEAGHFLRFQIELDGEERGKDKQHARDYRNTREK
jgi:hypothetical protein